MLSRACKNTWTAVAAYEASFYGAKAFCYLLGFASLGRDSKIYLDAFHETERKVGKIKTKFHDTIRVHRLDDRLTHDVLWALTERLIETTDFEKDLLSIKTKLRLIDRDKFSRFRNNIFYDGAFWPLQAEIGACDLTKAVYNSEITEAAQLESSALGAPFAAEYFATATLLRQLIVAMFQSIAELAPGLEDEVSAFDALCTASSPPQGVEAQ